MNEQNSRWNPKVSPIWALILVPIAFFGLKWWFEGLSRRPTFNRSHVVSELKQLGTAILIYGEANDEHLPYFHPFEFGIDPLVEYCKSSNNLHFNPFPPHDKLHKSGTTDHRFQFVLNKRTLVGGKEVRLVYDPWQSESFEQDVLITSLMLRDNGEQGSVTCFGDGHVKWILQEKFVATLPPQGDFPSAFRIEDLLFAMPEDKTPAKFWTVPYEAVESAARTRGGSK